MGGQANCKRATPPGGTSLSLFVTEQSSCAWRRRRGLVLYIFQLYRLIILPIANTWMSWSLLQKLEVQPGWGVISGLALVVAACIGVGTQVCAFFYFLLLILM